MKDWQGRLKAAGWHLIISLVVCVLAAALVFGIWYPYPYREVSGGRELFLLVIAVDVAMGPLITLVVFNRAKPRREQIMDFSVVGLLQLAALCYGLWTVYIARPVHLVFEYSRFVVVHAIDVDPQLLRIAPEGMRSLPKTGPVEIGMRPFASASEQFDATMAALQGGLLAARSDFWQPYAASVKQVLNHAKPMTELQARFPQAQIELEKAVKSTGKTSSQLRSLPMVGRDQAWTVLVDADTAKPLAFLPLDSF